jgi:hypothetical protein
VPTAPGVGPRHLAVDADRGRAYVINELVQSVSLYEINAFTGKHIFFAKSTFFHAEITFFHAEITLFQAGITFFHAGRCSVKKSNSSVKKSNFSVKKSTFFHAQATFFPAGITFFQAGEKAGFGYSAVEGSLNILHRTLYGKG